MGPYEVNSPDLTIFSNGEFLNGLSVNICSTIFRHFIKSHRVESSQPKTQNSLDDSEGTTVGIRREL